MSGITGLPFRRFIRELNGRDAVGLFTTEFVSVEGLTRHNLPTLRLARLDPGEKPVAIQIFGRDIWRLTDAAKLMQDRGADIIDINAGCPAPKIVRKGGGAELLRNLIVLHRILAAVVKAVSIPVTLKTRTGWNENIITAHEVARRAAESGIRQLCLHGRTKEQGYRGESDWNLIAAVAAGCPVPVIGSGDIGEPAQADEYIKKYGVAGVAIGRAAMKNPWIFRQIEDLRAGRPVFQPSGTDMIQALERYQALLSEDGYPLRGRLNKSKQLLNFISRGQAGAQHLRRRCLHAESLEEFNGMIREFYAPG
jgi:nifR3 family TIM-barrel protein